MAILNLNGFSVPLTANKADMSDDEVGSTQRAASGTLLTTRMATRRKGDFETPWLPPSTIRALRELVRGRGDRFPFNLGLASNNTLQAIATTIALYSAKGLYPSTLQGCGLRGPELLAFQGAPTVSVPYFAGGTCLAIEGNTFNDMLAAVAACSATTGFTTNGALTHVTNTSPAPPLPQLDAIQVTDNSGLPYIQVANNISGLTGGAVYVFSAYVLAASGTPNLTVSVLDETNSTVAGQQTVVISANGWTRVQVAFTAALTNHQYAPQLSLGVTGTFYTAGWQLEVGQPTNGNSPLATTWIAGATTRNAPEMQYTLQELRGVDDLTVMFWLFPEVVPTNGNKAMYFYVSSNALGSGNEVALYLDSTGNIHLQTGSDILTPPPSGGGPPAWLHCACTLQRGANFVKKTLYINGVQAAQDSPNVPCAWGDYPAFYLGTDSAYANVGQGLYAELLVLPFAATSDMISAWYNRQFSNLPLLSVGGDGLFATDNAPLSCVGKVGKVQQTLIPSIIDVPAGLGQKLSFSLTEQ